MEYLKSFRYDFDYRGFRYTLFQIVMSFMQLAKLKRLASKPTVVEEREVDGTSSKVMLEKGVNAVEEGFN